MSQTLTITDGRLRYPRDPMARMAWQLDQRAAWLANTRRLEQELTNEVARHRYGGLPWMRVMRRLNRVVSDRLEMTA